MTQLPPNTPETIISLRKRMGLTQTELALRMGYPLRSWQRKEALGKTNTLTLSEFEYLLLIADAHPQFQLQNKKPA